MPEVVEYENPHLGLSGGVLKPIVHWPQYLAERSVQIPASLLEFLTFSLADFFLKNFEKYKDFASEEILAGAPKY